MSKHFFTAALCALILALLPSNSFAQTIKGNGKIKTDVRQLSGFDKIVVQGQVDLYLSQESTENVKIEADENLIELFQTIVNNETLYVIVPDNMKKTLTLNITIAFKELKQITLLNEVELKNDRVVNFDDICILCGGGSRMNFEFKATNARINLFDAGSAILRGYTENFTVDAHDDSELNAFDLQADKCNITGSGYAEISVNVKKEMSLTISGHSNLYFMGEPVILQRNFDSSGLITKRKTGTK